MAKADTGKGFAKLDGVGQKLEGWRKIKGLTWSKYTTDGHALTLIDSGGDVIADITCSGTSGTQHVRHLEGQWVEDLEVSALGSGEVWISYC